MNLRIAAINFVAAENVTDREELLFRAHRHASNLTGQLPVPVAQRVVQSFVAAVNREISRIAASSEEDYEDIKRRMDDIFNDPAWADMGGTDNRSRWEQPHGSVNGATWNVGLHLGSDYDHYHDGLLDSLRSANPTESLKRYVHHNAELDGGQFGDVPSSYLHLVDWKYLADPETHGLEPQDLNEIHKQYPDMFGDTRDPDEYLDPNDPRIKGANRTLFNDEKQRDAVYDHLVRRFGSRRTAGINDFPDELMY